MPHHATGAASGYNLQEYRAVMLPLTTAQRGLWMTQFLAPKGSSLNIAEAIHLHGIVDESLFRKALTSVQTEAETLRTAIIRTDDGPVYAIRPPSLPECPVIDCRDEADPSLFARRWMQERIQAPLDLERDPLWQNALLRVASTHWIWFHCCHHAILDGFSGGMIVSRVAALYTALTEGRDAPAPGFLPLATLHEQEEAYRASPRFEIDKAYWRETLQDAPEPVSLSLRPHRVTTGDFGGAITRAATLCDARAEALRALGRTYESSLPQTLTALLVSYLHRLTGQSDLVVGMPVSARANRLLRQTPGMVANAVALRFMMSPETSFAELIIKSRRAMRSALRHQQYRYEDMRRDLGMFNNTTQISRIGINIEPFDYNLSFGPAHSRNENLSNGAMEDLTLFVFDRCDGGGLCIQCDANPALYTADELDAHLARILTLTDQLLASPETPLRSIPLLTQEARHAQGVRNAATRRVWPDITLSALIASGIGTGPDKVVQDHKGALTRDDFQRHQHQLTMQLRAAGARPGTLVALALPRDRRMLLCVAAVAATGAAWLPIDVDAPQPRARLILEDACPTLVILPDADHIGWACGHEAWQMDAATLVLRSLAPAAPQAGFAPLSASRLPEDTAYVTYTSGTTGRPKGVIIPRKALLNFLHSIRDILDFSERETLLAVTAWTFDIAILEMLLPLVSGSRCVIATPEDVRDPGRLCTLIRQHDVTALQATPTLWQTLLGTAESSSLRGLLFLSGGEAMPAHMARQMGHLGRAVYNLYGPTETTIWSTACRLTADEPDSPPAGLPLANTRLYVVDPFGQTLPDGVVGELVIAGDGVASGYLNRPELTESRFIPDPEGNAGALAYRTGDRAAIDSEGVLSIFGRADCQIKIRGMRIEPGEIESTLLSLPEILQAAVMIEETASRDQPLLAAYLVPATEGAKLDAAQIRRTLLGLLPPQMIPVRIVCVDALLRLTSGKLDRAALRAMKEDTIATNAVYASTPAEKMLAALWSDLLGLEKIDIHASFFDLGGDSIMVVQMISLLSEQGYTLPVGQIFAAPTIALLAPLFEGGPITCDPLATRLAIRPHGNGAPLFCVHPVIGMSWSFNTLAPLLPDTRPVYGLQDAGLLLGANPPRTLNELTAHYVQEIRAIQPHGPYHLLGWSMGGVIAHEIAAAFRREGQDVALLAMLDSYPTLTEPGCSHRGASGGPLDDPDSPQAIRAALGFLKMPLDNETPLPPTLEALADLFLATLDTTLLPDLPTQDLGDLMGLAEKLRLVTRRNIEMLMTHRPTHGETDILFLRAADKGDMTDQISVTDDPLSWANYSSGRITVHDLPCRHGDMLLPGHVEMVARLIRSHPAFGQPVCADLSAA
ncbi:amino acid adenylation domain-containing protein [Asaia siamensis]|nr:non-ribosomal peptide synthetase [Asaia siamensis]